jgi:hypothetical protein
LIISGENILEKEYSGKKSLLLLLFSKNRLKTKIFLKYPKFCHNCLQHERPSLKIFSTFIFWMLPNLAKYFRRDDHHLSNITKLKNRHFAPNNWWLLVSNISIYVFKKFYILTTWTFQGSVIVES